VHKPESEPLYLAAKEKHVRSHVKTCKECAITAWCGKDCRKAVNKAGHFKMCGKPPFVTSHSEGLTHVDKLLAKIMSSDDEIPKENLLQGTAEDSDGEDDDSAVWESVGSGDESSSAHPSLSQVILEAFPKENQLEEPAFARIYAEYI